jgi:hypothetical protein
MGGILDVHMSGEHVGEAARLSATHGVGLAVIENGPAPDLPMRSVARWQLMMALTLSVPHEDWLTPWLQTVTVHSVAANSS